MKIAARATLYTICVYLVLFGATAETAQAQLLRFTVGYGHPDWVANTNHYDYIDTDQAAYQSDFAPGLDGEYVPVADGAGTVRRYAYRDVGVFTYNKEFGKILQYDCGEGTTATWACKWSYRRFDLTPGPPDRCTTLDIGEQGYRVRRKRISCTGAAAVSSYFLRKRHAPPGWSCSILLRNHRHCVRPTDGSNADSDPDPEHAFLEEAQANSVDDCGTVSAIGYANVYVIEGATTCAQIDERQITDAVSRLAFYRQGGAQLGALSCSGDANLNVSCYDGTNCVLLTMRGNNNGGWLATAVDEQGQFTYMTSAYDGC